MSDVFSNKFLDSKTVSAVKKSVKDKEVEEGEEDEEIEDDVRAPVDVLGIWLANHQLALPNRFGIRNNIVRSDDPDIIKDIEIYVLSPTKALHNQVVDTINKNKKVNYRLSIQNQASMVILMICNRISMLFTGDAPQRAIIDGLRKLPSKLKAKLKQLDRIEPTKKTKKKEKVLCVDYMDIPHHGS